jgi:chemotaxis regulatin CheY-phosphate phosphatase CheZ
MFKLFKSKKKISMYEAILNISKTYQDRENQIIHKMGKLVSEVFNEELEIFGLNHRIMDVNNERIKERFKQKLENLPKAEFTPEEIQSLLDREV